MKVLAAAFAYNEGDKIRRTVTRHPQTRSYDLLVMDDGSTDGMLESMPNTAGCIFATRKTTASVRP